MKGKFLLLGLVLSLRLSAQTDSSVVIAEPATKKQEDAASLKVFYSQKLINTKTVEVLKKGILAFSVNHNFGDVAGNNGGIKNFFGLDEAADVQLGFQIGLSDKLNLVLNRTRGFGAVRRNFETGLKYQFVRQKENGHPFSITAYANIVASSLKANPLDSQEASFRKFSDRLSQMVQLMVARRFGNISLQLSPTYLHTNLVIPSDQNSLFAIGAGVRIPLSKKIVIISDYFHAFRSDESRNALIATGFTPHDVFGIGVEILTEGHMFHLNFTNAQNLLENRFLPRTSASWGDGQFRWGFTISRNFVLFRNKKNK